jgi:ABC-type multidrug transport system fused ATPase/permease subunit
MIIVFVAPRVQLARQTDRIFVIGNKHILAAGTHRELVSFNNLYCEAYTGLISPEKISASHKDTGYVNSR